MAMDDGCLNINRDLGLSTCEHAQADETVKRQDIKAKSLELLRGCNSTLLGLI